MFKGFALATVLILSIALTVSACSPSEAELQEAVEAALAATQEAQPIPTAVPTVIDTATPVPTNTPIPTATYFPTSTPFPTLESSVVNLGGQCVDPVTGESYFFQKQLTKELWTSLAPNVQSFVDMSSDETYILSLLYTFVADDWLFIDELIFNVDGEVYHLKPDSTSSDIFDSGDIYEAGTKVITRNDFDLVEDIIRGETVLVRFSGSDGSYDYTLTDEEKGVIEYSYLVYQALVNDAVSPSDFVATCPN